MYRWINFSLYPFFLQQVLFINFSFHAFLKFVVNHFGTLDFLGEPAENIQPVIIDDQFLQVFMRYPYEDIKKAFAPYYKDTILFETISPSDIRDLDRELDTYDFLDVDDIDEFNGYLYQAKRSDVEPSRCCCEEGRKEVRNRPGGYR